MMIFSSARLRLIAAVAVVFNGIFPAIWVLFTSLKTEIELMHHPITYFPNDPTFINYITAFTDQPLFTFFMNSIIVAFLTAISSIIVSSLAAYAIARLHVRFRSVILSCIVAVAMFPMVTLMVPLFVIMRDFGLLNSYTALVLPYTVFNLPICTMLLVSFFQDIPRDIENAAMLDGCSRSGALWRVVLPLSMPGLATAMIISFVNAWDEFLLSLSFNSAVTYRTLPVGIQLYQGEFTFPWPIISAALVVAMIPIIIMIVVFQEKVISGLTAGGLKG